MRPSRITYCNYTSIEKCLYRILKIHSSSSCRLKIDSGKVSPRSDKLLHNNVSKIISHGCAISAEHVLSIQRTSYQYQFVKTRLRRVWSNRDMGLFSFRPISPQFAKESPPKPLKSVHPSGSHFGGPFSML